MSEFDTFDDSDDWIPLKEDQDINQINTAVIERPNVKDESIIILKPSSTQHRQRKTSSLDEIRGRHERNIILKTHLVDKPLSLIPIAFLRHFLHEIWNARYSIRLGIFLLVLGSFLQCLSLVVCVKGFMTARFFLVAIGISSFVYVRGFHLLRTFSMDIDSMIPTILDHLTGSAIRNSILFVVHFLPFLSQAWSYFYLSQTISVSSNLFLCFCLLLLQVAILLRLNVNFDVLPNGKHWFEYKNGACYVGNYILTRKASSSPFDSRLHAWIYLYTLATISSCVSIRHNGFGDAIFLLAPLLMSSGLLLLATSRFDENGNDILIPLIRRICRQTLADVLKQVGDNVSGNDMFRLTMLRWIVDYWATASPKPDSIPQGKTRPFYSLSQPNDDIQVKSNVEHDTADTETSTGTCDGIKNISSSNINHNQIDWTNLCAMLGMTTSQMFSEVAADNHQSQHENKSVSNIRNIINSLNVDDRARPIVESYKRAVNQCRIPRNMSIVLAISSRCPGIASILYLLVTFSGHVGNCTVLLVPVIALEFTRVMTWLKSCQSAYPNALDSNGDDLRSHFNFVPMNMPSMDILLSKDDISIDSRGTALQIWYNVESSISALESGLVAVKCVHTASVATDLAFNVMSLSKYATELHSVGFAQGLFTVLLDIFLFHMDSTDDMNKSSRQNNRTKISSTTAAVVDNTNMLKKNLSELLDGDNVRQNIVSPIISLTHKVSSGIRIPHRNVTGAKKEDQTIVMNKVAKSQTQENEINNIGKEDAILDDISPLTSDVPAHDNIDPLPNDLELHGDVNHTKENITNEQVIDNEIDDDDDASWEDLSDHLDLHNTEESQMDTKLSDETLTSKSVIAEDVRHIEIDTPGNNEALKWVGIGSAIFGTVMGGIALANNIQNAKRKDQGGPNSCSRRTSTVTKIERLDDDEDSN